MLDIGTGNIDNTSLAQELTSGQARSLEAQVQHLYSLSKEKTDKYNKETDQKEKELAKFSRLSEDSFSFDDCFYYETSAQYLRILELKNDERQILNFTKRDTIYGFCDVTSPVTPKRVTRIFDDKSKGVWTKFESSVAEVIRLNAVEGQNLEELWSEFKQHCLRTAHAWYNYFIEDERENHVDPILSQHWTQAISLQRHAVETFMSINARVEQTVGRKKQLVKQTNTGKKTIYNYKTFLTQYETNPAKPINHLVALKAYREHVLYQLPELAETARKIVQSSTNSQEATFPDFPAYVTEDARRLHTYITGGTGSGKSELMKVLIHEYIKRPDYGSVVIIDPHGPLARQVARFKEFAGSGADRLVYIDPALSYDQAATINPFYVKPVEDRREYQWLVDTTAQEIGKIIAEIVAPDTGGLTGQMKTLLMPCISTVIYAGKTLADLQRFMIKETNEDLVRRGLKSPNRGHRLFFQSMFHDSSYAKTKSSIATRIMGLLSTEAFYDLTIGSAHSTFEFAQALNSKKVIVFNLSRGQMGPEASSAFGRFVIAMLQSFALKRDRELEKGQTPVPVHVFVDECQLYITESIEAILSEARKYGVHLTLAQQIAGQNMSPQLTRMVLGNTAIKLVGKNGEATLNTMSKEIRADLDDLRALRGKGHFFLKAGDSLAYPIQAPAHLLGSANAMTGEAWEAVVAGQLERYYQPKDDSDAYVDADKPLYDLDT